MIRTLFIVLTIGIISCSKSASINSGELSDHGMFSEEIISPDSEYLLVIKDNRKDTKNNSDAKEYMVLLNKDRTHIVYKGGFDSGYIKWYDTHRLEIFSTPGLIPPSKSKNDFIEIYNVKTKKSVKKSTLVGSSKD